MLHRFGAMRERTPDELDSTLIRAGSEAATFNEVAAFARMIDQRPIGVLLDDLARLEFLSGTKIQIARRALRRRFASLPQAELDAVRAHLGSLERSDPDAAERLRVLIGRFL